MQRKVDVGCGTKIHYNASGTRNPMDDIEIVENQTC